ncbi:phosphatase PAP2 family protein [Edaphobacter flagellatus]|uniref:phosphatase PAP2 family protein n=1 Tax=Edaphobacter flagellatus TaxID=1933044 RepID=UPI0021B4AD2B|nr:phosphatase PAP2 family protein [Edaphobacter flagellatus]
MRTSEWIQLGFSLLLALAAWLTPLPRQRQRNITTLALAAAVILAIALLIARALPPEAASILRDWLTVPLFLIPYWQTGQFFLAPNPRIQQRLLDLDHRLIPTIASQSGTSRTGIGFLLEMAYLSCYPLVPLGLLSLYLANLRSQVAGFWLVVLIATYLCYAITPFVPAYPPRSLVEPAATPPPAQINKGRVFNRWILQHGSIHAISFPSAHVASAFSVAFVLLHASIPIGLLFLGIAIAISLGAVIGRYHYALDVILGALLAFLTFVACLHFL